MDDKDTFTCAFKLYERIMIHATGHPAKVLAISLAAATAFGAAALAAGIREAMGRQT